MKPLLIVVTGPTGSGKTDLAIELARHFSTEIVSADSRQVYRHIPVGTAAPTAAQLAAAPHHLVGFLELDQYYSAARFADDATAILRRIWSAAPRPAIVCGGSMLYIDALVKGLDELPTVSEAVRSRVLAAYQAGGAKAIIAMLRELDPDYLAVADRCNHKRLIHAAEVSAEAGVPYSSLLGKTPKERDFRTVTMMIDRPRAELFARINARVDAMMAAGLEEEARSVYHLRRFNSLNTVGFKEMFAMFDGTMPRDIAIPRIAKNTRVYAKKQLTWLQRNPGVIRLDASRPLLPQALDHINAMIES